MWLRLALLQSRKHRVQLLSLDVRGGSRDDVSRYASEDVSFIGRQATQFLRDQCFDNRDKRVSVVIAKWSEPLTLKADL
jgi:hypothetical protein